MEKTPAVHAETSLLGELYSLRVYDSSVGHEARSGSSVVDEHVLGDAYLIGRKSHSIMGPHDLYHEFAEGI
jgi:hypothetical protein